MFVRHYRTWVEISRHAVRHNMAAVQRLIGSRVGIMPIVKANAYGHGVEQVLSILRGYRQWGIGVAYGIEALEARAQGYRGRVVVLSNWNVDELPKLIAKDIELVVWDKPSYQAIQHAAHKSRTKPKVHLKLDTGTTRIGFLPTDIKTINQILNDEHLRVVGTFSHFANAEERSSIRTLRQLKRFTTLTNKVGVTGGNRGGEGHIACTAAILRYPEARFGLVRLGIGLYGLWPSAQIEHWSGANLRQFGLQPALSWYSQLAQIKTIPAGTGVGYGSSVIASRPIKVGVVPVGYADGYDRRLSNRGWVVVLGKPAPILGRICMNLMMIDLTKTPSPKVGTKVTLLGLGVTADDIAKECGTINYEMTTRINWSLPRMVV